MCDRSLPSDQNHASRKLSHSNEEWWMGMSSSSWRSYSLLKTKEIQLWTCQAIYDRVPCLIRQTGRETASTIIELDLDVAAIWLPHRRRSTKGTPSGFRSSRLKFADWRYVCYGWASQLPLGRRASREPIMLESSCARSGLSDPHTYVLPSLHWIALLILDKLVILYTTLATPFLLRFLRFLWLCNALLAYQLARLRPFNLSCQGSHKDPLSIENQHPPEHGIHSGKQGWSDSFCPHYWISLRVRETRLTAIYKTLIPWMGTSES